MGKRPNGWRSRQLIQFVQKAEKSTLENRGCLWFCFYMFEILRDAFLSQSLGAVISLVNHTNANTAMNQSKLKAITCIVLKARENVRLRLVLVFVSRWLKRREKRLLTSSKCSNEQSYNNR